MRGDRAWTAVELLRMLQEEEDEHERADERGEEQVDHTAEEETPTQAAITTVSQPASHISAISR